MTIDEARHIAKTTKSYTLRRDMLKYIKRKERENGRQERQPSSAQRANKDRTTANRNGWR